MSQYIKVFPADSDEYKRLQAAAKLLTAFTSDKFYTDVTYFDKGQNWQWTTIIKRIGNQTCQILNPKDQETIVSGSYSDYMNCIENLIENNARRVS